MLTRRYLLKASAALAAGCTAAPAFALTEEPMPAADIEALNLACSNARDAHAALISEARLLLEGEVKLGKRAADYDTTVICPLCHCSLRVLPAPAL